MKKIFLLSVLILGLFSILDLFHPGLPITHDGQDHIARIANFYKNLSEGNIIPRWAPNLNWGYGHPVLEFLYPLPSYLASFFHFLNISLIDSVKIVLGLGIVFSGLFMFLWLSEFLSFSSAFIGAILYMLAPYRIVNLFVRGDIGENLAFVFMPLVLFFVYKLKSKLSWLNLAGISFSVAALVLSHNAVSLIYFPFIVLYGLWIGRKNSKYLVNFFIAFILGFGLSAFFWIPGLLEAKYTLRNIVTAGAYADRFVGINQLVYGPWSYGGTGEFTVQLGVFQWIALAFSLIWSARSLVKKKNVDLLQLILVIYVLIAVFIMLPYSNFIWSKVLLLQNFQFPWRFLAIPVFACAALAAIGFDLIKKKFKKIAILLFVVTFVILNKGYWHANGYLQKPESAFTGVYDSTTDTGESAPIWSVRFMEKRSDSALEVISGKAEVVNIDRKAILHSYKIKAETEVRIRENTLYFPGWEVLVDGRKVSIQFQDAKNRGLITFFVPSGEHRVDIVFSETKLRFISDLISIASLILILSYNIWRIKIWQRFR